MDQSFLLWLSSLGVAIGALLFSLVANDDVVLVGYQSFSPAVCPRGLNALMFAAATLPIVLKLGFGEVGWKRMLYCPSISCCFILRQAGSYFLPPPLFLLARIGANWCIVSQKHDPLPKVRISTLSGKIKPNSGLQTPGIPIPFP